MKSERWTYAVLATLVTAGFFLPLWPLGVISIVVAALLHKPFVALSAGLFFDVAWGAPLGWYEPLIFPFVLTALLSVLVRLLADRYFFSKSPPLKLY